ncbi:hypothetical protein HPB48_010089 [Haemaphysalis longicornis]|uniref:Uncharacterized protein n=1 Tax=Haemaphysalis longicornis TaxID=44386 RepID=A0A9J6G078_HAELO|nr:hypothetical protein HPB48_010089 [Haemaphysalis longicornis]
MKQGFARLEEMLSTLAASHRNMCERFEIVEQTQKIMIRNPIFGPHRLRSGNGTAKASGNKKAALQQHIRPESPKKLGIMMLQETVVQDLKLTGYRAHADTTG